MTTSLDKLGETLAHALVPLSEVAGQPETIERALASLGFAPPPGIDLGTVLTLDTKSVVDKLENLLRSTPEEQKDTSLMAGRSAELTLVVAELVDGIRKFAEALPTTLAAAGDYVAKTQITKELPRRLLDLLVVGAVGQVSPTAAFVLRTLGIFGYDPYPVPPAAPGIYQVAHRRTVIRYERLQDLFSDPRKLFVAEYGWGTASFDAESLLTNIGLLVQSLGMRPSVRDMPRAVEEALTGQPMPNAANDPSPQLLLPITTRGTTTPVDVSLSLHRLRPISGSDAGLELVALVSGATGASIPISTNLALRLDASLDLGAGVGVALRPTGAELRTGFLIGGMPGTGAAGRLGIGLQRKRADGNPSQILSAPGGTRVEADDLLFEVGCGLAIGESPDPYILAAVTGGHIVITLGDADGFLNKVVPTEGIESRFDLKIRWSRNKGLRFEGSGMLEIAIPVHETLGPFRLDIITLRLGTMDRGLQLTAAVTGGIALGPVQATIEKVGIRGDLKFGDGNLGNADFSLGFKPPSGAGLAIKAGPVTGGGYLFFDPDNEQYAGVLQLSFKAISLTAIGLLTTRLPDATGGSNGDKKGFSLLIIITADFPPIQIGFGFSLNGVGGLLGVNRTMVVGTLRAGVKNRTVESILFPKDPVARAPQIISDLRSIFPPAEGRYVFGPMVKIGWGPNSILEIEAALVLELMAPIRLVILGKIQVVLPEKKDPVLQLRLDMVGVIDFGQCEASVDASLVDSKLAMFALTGDMAMRVAWGATKTFVLAAGGFNRRFQPPVGFPPLERLAISLADSDNPRLRLATYLALTSNTIQFGAELDIYVKAETIVGVFTVSAIVAFDALIQYQPILFIADLRAAIDIARNGKPFLHAALAATLSGPTPWHAIGYVEFDCFGRHRIDVEVTVGLPFEPPQTRITPLEIANMLVAAISRADTWSALPPADGGKLVSLRDAPVTAPRTGTPSAAATIAVHPLGLLTIRQRVIPLGKTITRLGEAAVDPVSFALEGVSIGNLPAAPLDEVRDDFAPGQYEVLEDDQKLARPAFESMRSGVDVRTTTARLPADATTGISVQIAYEEVVIDAQPTSGIRASRPLNAKPPRRGSKRPSLPSSVIAGLVHGGAAAHAQTRAGGSEEFAGLRRPVRVGGERYVATNADTLSAVAGSPSGASYAEAQEQASAATSSGAPLEVALLHEAA